MKIAELFMTVQPILMTMVFCITLPLVLQTILKVLIVLSENDTREKQQEVEESTNNKFNQEVISVFRSYPKMYEALKRLNGKYAGDHSKEIDAIFGSMKGSGFIENTHYQHELSEKLLKRIRKIEKANLSADTTSKLLKDLEMDIEKFNKTFWAIEF